MSGLIIYTTAHVGKWLPGEALAGRKRKSGWPSLLLAGLCCLRPAPAYPKLSLFYSVRISICLGLAPSDLGRCTSRIPFL